MGLSAHAKVGIFALVAMIVFGIIVSWKSDIFLRQQGYEMIGSFTSIEGLTIGSEVRYRGYKVGKVIKIDPGPADVKIYAIIDKKIHFPKDSYLRVSFDGIVGLKFLDVGPGTATDLYKSGEIIYGKSTSGIVDFVDIGAQNLQETKRILIAIRDFIENPRIKQAFFDAVVTTDKITKQIDALTAEIRIVTQSIMDIVSDPEFQANIKGTMAATHKTLASADDFFQGVSNLKVRPSGDVFIGNAANQVRANLDVIVGDKMDYFRLGMGEGPTKSLSLQDILVSRKINDKTAFHLGMINAQLGGGIDLKTWAGSTVSGDLYNINNKPGYPKVRLTASQKIADYVDLAVQADDLLNSSSANYSIGVKVGENK